MTFTNTGLTLPSSHAYENDGSMDHDAALECRHAFSDNHQARSLPSTFETPQKSSCGKSIPNNFMEAGPFRHAVGGICNDLADKLIQKGLEKGGNAIQHKFKGTAYHKKASWLNDNKNVIFEVAMNLTPQTRAALKSANIAQGTLNSLCHDGLTKLGTKGEGCTQELGYYKDHVLYIPIDHAVTTAVKNGVSDLFINNAKDFFGTLSMNWRNP